jgi:hypothetical protein
MLRRHLGLDFKRSFHQFTSERMHRMPYIDFKEEQRIDKAFCEGQALDKVLLRGNSRQTQGYLVSGHAIASSDGYGS